MPPTAPTELRTARLLLRSFQPTDVDTLVSLANVKEIAAMTLRLPFPYTRKDAEDFLQGSVLKLSDGHAVFAIESKGRLAGTIGLHANHQHRKAELGYWIGKPFWGRGFATEAAAEVIRWGFEEQKLNRIYAGCFADNPASMRVLEKLGFKHEGVSREHILKWGTFKDVHQYSLLAREYNRR